MRAGIITVDDMPAGVLIIENYLMINVGGPSPDWVNELAASPVGERLLRRILAGIVRRSKVTGAY